MYELINGVRIKKKMYKGQPVVTLADIDNAHDRPAGTARKRFNDNKKHFIEGEAYFIVNQTSEIRTFGIERPQGGTPAKVTASTNILFTKGTINHV